MGCIRDPLVAPDDSASIGRARRGHDAGSGADLGARRMTVLAVVEDLVVAAAEAGLVRPAAVDTVAAAGHARTRVGAAAVGCPRRRDNAAEWTVRDGAVTVLAVEQLERRVDGEARLRRGSAVEAVV